MKCKHCGRPITKTLSADLRLLFGEWVHIRVRKSGPEYFYCSSYDTEQNDNNKATPSKRAVATLFL